MSDLSHYIDHEAYNVVPREALDKLATPSLLSKLRAGTEVLRTGGGATLTVGECRVLLDLLEPTRQSSRSET